MSRSLIRTALETHLATLSPAWPTAWENVPFTPTAGQSWQRATILFSDTRALTIGAGGPEEWSGHLHIQVWTHAGQGPQAAEARAALLIGDRAAGVIGHFYRGQALTSGAAVVTIYQPVTRPALTSDPAWFGLPVLVPFSCMVG